MLLTASVRATARGVNCQRSMRPPPETPTASPAARLAYRMAPVAVRTKMGCGSMSISHLWKPPLPPNCVLSPRAACAACTAACSASAASLPALADVLIAAACRGSPKMCPPCIDVVTKLAPPCCEPA